MSSDLFFNNKKYITVREASLLTGYSKDHIGKLCRFGSITSKRVGQIWYVEEESVIKHKDYSLLSDFSKIEDKYISVKDASLLSGYAKDYISRLCRQKLVVSKMIGRAWFVSEESLLNYKNTPTSFDFTKNLEGKGNVTVSLSEEKIFVPEKIHRKVRSNILISGPTGSRVIVSVLVVLVLFIGLVSGKNVSFTSLTKDISSAPMDSYKGVREIIDFYSNKLEKQYLSFGNKIIGTKISGSKSEVAAIITTLNPLNSTSLSFYYGVNNFLNNFVFLPIARVFNVEPGTTNTVYVVQNNPPPVSPPVAATTTPTKVVNTTNIVQRIIQTILPNPDSVTNANLDGKLKDLSDKLTADMNLKFGQLSTGTGGAVNNIYQIIAQGQRIDELTNTLLTNPRINNGTITGGSITGTTISGTINPNLTPGSVLFQGASGLAQDNSNFFWNSTSHSLGIGTTNPPSKLTVLGSFFAGGPSTGITINNTTISGGYGPDAIGTGDIPLTISSVGNSNLTLNSGGNILMDATNFGNAITIRASGGFGSGIILDTANVGIGTADSAARLDIAATAGTDTLKLGNADAYEIKFAGPDAANIYQSEPGQFMYISTNGGKLNLGSSTDHPDLVISGGNVGIGTTSPDSSGITGTLLHVAGTGLTRGILNLGSNSVVTNNPVGTILFTSASTRIAQIDAVANTNSSTQGYMAFYTNGGSITERMHIDSSGNIGIGTTTPQWLLNPTSGTAPQLSLSAGGGLPQWAMRNAGGNLYIATTTVSGTATSTPSALTIIGNTGNVGIGTTNPTKKLVVSNGRQFYGIGIDPDNLLISLTDTAGVQASIGYTFLNNETMNFTTRFDNSNFVFNQALTEVMRIAGTNLGIGTTSPGSLLSVGGNAVGINFGLGTSTFSTSGGINLAKGGCFAVGGACLGSGGGSGSVLSSTLQGQVPFYNSVGTTLTATSSLFISKNGNVGIGTTTPYSKLSIGNLSTDSVAPLFTIASSTAGATTTLLTVLNNGNVGIGKINPTNNLDIFVGSNNPINKGITLNTSGSSAGSSYSFNYNGSDFGGLYSVLGAPGGLLLDTKSGTGPITLSLGGAVHFTLNTDGTVTLSNNQSGKNSVGAAQILTLSDPTGSTGSRTEIAVGYQGGTFRPAALGYVVKDGGGNTNGDVYIATRGVTTDSAPVERLTVTAAGSVGIGTTSPGSILSVGGNAVGINFDLATSTFSTSGGINLIKGGCFAVNGVCLGGAGGGGSLPLTGTGATVVADTPLLNMTETWNNAAVTFNGILENITSTNSAALSKLIDLQISGASKFKVDKTGLATVANGVSFPSGTLISNPLTTDGYLSITNAAGTDFTRLYLGPQTTAGSLIYQSGGTITLYAGDLSHNADLTVGTLTAQSQVNQSALIVQGNSINAGSNPFVTVTGTWNNAGGDFIAIKSNITNTASNVNSKLIDLQVGGVSRFNVNALSGNVGIGTTSPYQKLSVAGNVIADSFIATSTTATSTISTGGLAVGTSQFVVQQNSGNIGIGTASPANQFDMIGSVAGPFVARIKNTSTASGNVHASMIVENSSSYGQLFKAGTNYSSYKNISGNDLGFYNTGGNISVLNDSGNINFDAGGSAAAQLTIGTNGNVGIGTTSPATTLEVKGALRISGTTSDTFTSPSAGASIPTKINIPVYDPGAFGQVLAMGLPSGAADTSRVVTFMDARSVQHQPSILLLSPDENQGLGLSYDGSNTTGYLKSSTALGFKIGGLTSATEMMRIDTAGNVGIGTTTPWAQLSVNPNALGSGVPEFVIGSSTSTHLVVTGNGNVGIGTVGPGTLLHLQKSNSTAYANVVPSIADVDQVFTNPANHVAGGVLTGLQFNLGGDAQNRVDFIGAITESAATRNSSLVFATDDSGLRTEKMRITGAGNVGIGTTNPQGILDISPPTASDIHMLVSTSNTADTYSLGVSTGNGRKISFESLQGTLRQGMVFGDASASTETVFGIGTDSGSGFGAKFVVRQDGNVGIGTNSPSTDKLVVAGDIRVGTSGTNGCIENFAGTPLAGSCSSDINLKKNVTPITGILSKFIQLQPITYQWRADEFPERHFGTETFKGLVAQDVAPLFPELVATDGRGFKTVDYGVSLQMLSIEAIKELTLKVQDLQANALGVNTGSLTGTIGQYVGAFFNNALTKVENGIAYMKGLVTETLTVGSPSNPNGMTIYDKITKEPRCISSENGVLTNTSGDCNNLILGTQTPPSIPTPTSTPTPTPPSTPPAAGGNAQNVGTAPVIAILNTPTPPVVTADSGLVTYAYTVWNVGTSFAQTLVDVKVTDDKCSPITFISGDLNNDGKLNEGENWEYSCATTLSQTTTNTATVIGYSDDASHEAATAFTASTVVVVPEQGLLGTVPSSNIVPPAQTASSSDTILLPNTGSPGDAGFYSNTGLRRPLIHIVKLTKHALPIPFVGGMNTYIITNPGVVPIHGLAVTDNTCVPISYVSGDTNGNNLLDPTESWTYTCASTGSFSTRSEATVNGSANGFTSEDTVITNSGLTNTITIILVGVFIIVSGFLLIVVFRKYQIIMVVKQDFQMARKIINPTPSVNLPDVIPALDNKNYAKEEQEN